MRIYVYVVQFQGALIWEETINGAPAGETVFASFCRKPLVVVDPTGRSDCAAFRLQWGR
ncbi:hypothetical protein ACHHV8_06340 [Paenibacillus sp. TAB 01]|uniref:hypothetical protein n=1 Tax=Paenibacillus sp. TAB 01 TaxID=3368988 RepID=UPI003753AC74